MRQDTLRRRGLVTLIALVAFTSACTKEKRDAPLAVAGTSGAATLSSIQTDIFALSCAASGCHDNRANPAANINLTSVASSYAALVGKPSTQAAGMKIVVAGDAGHSYLVNKLAGTQTLVGGFGDRMPQFSASLKADDIDRIITWINDGAKMN